ncbi:MAG TPA: hypothetical protein VMP68_31360 [Candidatus Eisenbacteria bacterium]|nr:hypothetical protein [Candidatus Eisenbacteria bacterium]
MPLKWVAAIAVIAALFVLIAIFASAVDHSAAPLPGHYPTTYGYPSAAR